MALQEPYSKRTAIGGETIPPSDHNKAEDQLEALTGLANRKWTTAGRPTPGAGDLYPLGFNTDLLVHEGWNGTAWIQFGSSGWEHIQTVRLTSPNATIALSNLSCGKAANGAKYNGLYLWLFLKANTGSISNPRMTANGDTTATNYWGAGAANDYRIRNGSLLLGTNNYMFEGTLFRTNAFSTELNKYTWRILSVVDIDGAAFAGAGQAEDGWKWLNPSNDNVLNTLDIVAPSNFFEIGSQARVFGLRPGI